MKKKAVALLSTSTLLLGLAAGAAAAPIYEKITANLDWSAKFEVNGQSWTPTDSSGNKFAPINYNGYNYLPVRAVSEALDVAINWDGSTRTIQLGERTDLIPIIDVDLNTSAHSMKTTDKQYTVQDGTDYESGVVLRTLNSASKKFTLQPKQRYQTVELTIFAPNPQHPIEIRIADENSVVLQELILDSDKTNDTVKLDIGGKNDIVISAKSKTSADEMIFVTGHYK